MAYPHINTRLLIFDTSVAARLYVKTHKFTGMVYEDQEFTSVDAMDANERLAADGSPYRWEPFECFQCQSFPCICEVFELEREEP